MTRANFPHRIAERQASAAARQAAYDLLTVDQKVAALPATGATKQRIQLLSRMEREKVEAKQATEKAVAQAHKQAKAKKGSK